MAGHADAEDTQVPPRPCGFSFAAVGDSVLAEPSPVSPRRSFAIAVEWSPLGRHCGTRVVRRDLERGAPARRGARSRRPGRRRKRSSWRRKHGSMGSSRGCERSSAPGARRARCLRSGRAGYDNGRDAGRPSRSTGDASKRPSTARSPTSTPSLIEVVVAGHDGLRILGVDRDEEGRADRIGVLPNATGSPRPTGTTARCRAPSTPRDGVSSAGRSASRRGRAPCHPRRGGPRARRPVQGVLVAAIDLTDLAARIAEVIPTDQRMTLLSAEVALDPGARDEATLERLIALIRLEERDGVLKRMGPSCSAGRWSAPTAWLPPLRCSRWKSASAPQPGSRASGRSCSRSSPWVAPSFRLPRAGRPNRARTSDSSGAARPGTCHRTGLREICGTGSDMRLPERRPEPADSPSICGAKSMPPEFESIRAGSVGGRRHGAEALAPAEEKVLVEALEAPGYAARPGGGRRVEVRPIAGMNEVALGWRAPRGPRRRPTRADRALRPRRIRLPLARGRAIPPFGSDLASGARSRVPRTRRGSRARPSRGFVPEGSVRRIGDHARTPASRRPAPGGCVRSCTRRLGPPAA